MDETYEAPLPAQCPRCAGAVRHERTATQYQEELPVQPPIVRAFHVHIGQCTQCRRRVQGRHPLQTSDALGAAAVQLGPQAVAFAVLLNKRSGLAHGKVARVAALLEWLWAWVTTDTTASAILPGRGVAQAATVIGRDYPGVLQHDGWHSYRHFTAAAHHTCLAHLLRRCRVLLLDSPEQPFVTDVKAILQAALTTRGRYHAGTVSAHGLAVARGPDVERLGQLLARTPSRRLAVRRFQQHLSVEFDAIFSFLFDPTLDATTWRAEHALRPAVVTRKRCGGGNRTRHGADSQQVLASVLRTADQRGLDATDLLVALLTAPTPAVPPSLRPIPAVH
jgi:transposase